MNGEHPWRDWLVVLVIFGGGLCAVMIGIKLLILWARRDDNDGGPKTGSDTQRDGPPAK